MQKLRVVPDRSDCFFDGTVSQQEAYDLGWWSMDECPLAKIIILADNDKAIRRRVPPYAIVIRSLHVDIAYVQRSGEHGRECARQARREVFIKEKFHSTWEISLRSRSAAKERQALMSAASRSGKSRSI